MQEKIFPVKFISILFNKLIFLPNTLGAQKIGPILHWVAKKNNFCFLQNIKYFLRLHT